MRYLNGFKPFFSWMVHECQVFVPNPDSIYALSIHTTGIRPSAIGVLKQRGVLISGLQPTILVVHRIRLCLVVGATDTPALARIGMKTDTPGFVAASSGSVAREGLDHPPWDRSGGTEAAAQRLRAMLRAEAVQVIAEAAWAHLARSTSP